MRIYAQIRAACGASKKWKLRTAAGILLVGISIYMVAINRFLSLSSPVPAQVLVLEGWIWSKPAMIEASEEFKRGYQLVVCVSGPLRAAEAPGTRSDAELARARLIKLGIDKRQIHCLTLPGPDRNRTYRSALATREWMGQVAPESTSINVFTVGVHARKSLVLFQKAFGPGYKVGIIAGTESEYPVKSWWASKKGIRLVVRNTAGYLYALLWPTPPCSQLHSVRAVIEM